MVFHIGLDMLLFNGRPRGIAQMSGLIWNSLILITILALWDMVLQKGVSCYPQTWGFQQANRIITKNLSLIFEDP
jgi:hypothetical protein